MVKKIKKNRSYSYNDRNIKPTLSDISGPIEEPLLDVNGETASIVKRFLCLSNRLSNLSTNSFCVSIYDCDITSSKVEQKMKEMHCI